MGEKVVRWAWLRYLPPPLDTRAAAEEISCPVKVLDLSQAGIRLALPQRVPVGAVLTVDLLLAPEKFGRTMFARVIQIEAKRLRTWIAECDFLARLTQDEVQALLCDSARPDLSQDKPASPPVPSINRRAFARSYAGMDIACSVAGRGEQGSLPATILNISNGGVCLTVGARFEVGESLKVAFASISRRFLCTERVVVRHTLQCSEDSYQLGCEFTKKLTHGDLAALTS